MIARFLIASAAGLALVAAPAAAQMNMPGMHMTTPAKPSAKEHKQAGRKAAAKKKATSQETANKPAAATGTSMQGMKMPMPEGARPPSSQGTPEPEQIPGTTMTMPTPAQPSAGAMPPMDHSQMEHGQSGQMPGMTMPMGAPAGHQMQMTGALGSYPMQRESSGTSWQPDSSQHMGVMTMSGDWMLMAHGVLNLVYDHQSGRRGDDKAFAAGMIMGMAQRPIGQGALQFRAMLSPDPLMGSRGYPLLLASGETANGRDRLIDRQHPHDFFMELSASVSQDIGRNSSVFVYAALPGEPAFGPPAFQEREAIMDSPEAPISHHWLDSTHISFGVVTAGAVFDRVKLEVSRFNGREPDQHRWDIETGPLDSIAVRVSWNPIRTLALQGSWGHFTDPEQLEPGVDQKRLSASVLWADEIAPGWKVAGTLAWGRKTIHGHSDDAVTIEGSLKHAGWTLFGRGEMTENRELIQRQDEPAYRVGKVSLGAVRDFKVADHLSFGLGGLFAVNFVPNGLAPLYGSHDPTGALAFVRLKLH